MKAVISRGWNAVYVDTWMIHCIAEWMRRNFSRKWGARRDSRPIRLTGVYIRAPIWWTRLSARTRMSLASIPCLGYRSREIESQSPGRAGAVYYFRNSNRRVSNPSSGHATIIREAKRAPVVSIVAARRYFVFDTAAGALQCRLFRADERKSLQIAKRIRIYRFIPILPFCFLFFFLFFPIKRFSWHFYIDSRLSRNVLLMFV